MPTSNQIDTAIKNIPQFFTVDKILKGECLKTKKGNPFCRPGGLCRVYKFQLEDGTVKALRLWTDIISEAKERSIAISDFLQNHPSKYFVNFECIENALVIDGKKYPIVLMDWCDGINMKSYISQCVEANELGKLKDLAHEFYLLTKELDKFGISHGDLHHDNILVQSDGSLRLIDYDSMYVPALKGYKDECMGYNGYQHPTAREKNEFLQPYTDYFSELIIYLSIEALIEKQSLWSELDMENQDQSFMIQPNEFGNFKQSVAYQKIKTLGGNVPILLKILCKYLRKNNLNELIPFYDFPELSGVLSIISNGISNYCIQCGSAFYSEEDLFCTKCGSKRI